MKTILRSLALICLLGLGSALRAYTSDITNFATGSTSNMYISIDAAEAVDVTFELIDNSTGQSVATITVLSGGPYYAPYHQWFYESYGSGVSGSYYYVSWGPSFSWSLADVPAGNYTLRYTYPDGFDSAYGYGYGTWGAYMSGSVSIY